MPRAPRLIRRSLIDAVESVLDSSPSGPDDLMDRLIGEFPDVDDDELEDALLHLPAAYETDSGWVDLLALADGVVLTHVVSAHEIEAGVVEAEPDFALWVRVADVGIPFGGGGEITLDVVNGDFVLRGPAGWLSQFQPQAVIALRLRGEALHLSEVRDDELSFADVAAQEIAEMLRIAARSALGAFISLRKTKPSIAPAPSTHLLENVIAALVGQREFLRKPVLPLEAILVLAGLEFADGEVALPGAPLDADADLLSDDDIVSRVGAGTFLHFVRLSPTFADEHAGDFFDSMVSVGAALFIADQVEAVPLSAQALDAIEARAVAAQQRAVVLVLRARSLEGSQDSAGAEALVLEALRLDPDLVPALVDAGEYAADRGDASTSDGFLKRAGVPSTHPLRTVLAPLLRLPNSSTARNQPCPCGSGRKFKMCCLRNEVHDLAARAPLVHARLWMWALRAPRRHLSDHLLSLMDPKFDQGDVIATDLAMFDPDVLSEYLARRGEFLRHDERELVEQWRESTLAPYEVTATGPGATVILRPLLGGDPVTVPDRAMSTSVRRLDMVICRILSDGERPRIMLPPFSVPRIRRQELLAAFAENDSHTIAAFFGPKAPPVVHNHDGQALVFCAREYRVAKAEAAQAWRKLSELLTESGRDSLDWLNPESKVLGSVRRLGLLWTLETNSVERMEGLLELVLDAAPGATLVSSSTESAADKMESAPRPRHLRAVPDLELQEAVREYIAEYERKWVDEAIPALGGRTPRECVAAGGTELDELRALLDDFESMGDEGMSAQRLRVLLGIHGT